MNLKAKPGNATGRHGRFFSYPVPALEAEAVPPMNAQASGLNADRQQAPANGTAEQGPSPALDEKAQAFWRGKLAAANSAARFPSPCADLECCLIPPLALNQFAVAEAKLPDGQAVPAALVLWARVSANLRYPIRLQPNEWRSGDWYWIVDAMGNENIIRDIAGELAKTAFGGKQFKMLRPLTDPAFPAQ